MTFESSPKNEPNTTMPITGSQSMWKNESWSYDVEPRSGANQRGSSSAMPYAAAASLFIKNWFHSSPLNGSPMAQLVSRDADEQSPLRDGPAVPAEVIFLAIMATLLALVSLAGVPLAPEPVAGEGSDALRQNWATRSGLVQHESVPQAEQPLPVGRGREPEASSR